MADIHLTATCGSSLWSRDTLVEPTPVAARRVPARCPPASADRYDNATVGSGSLVNERAPAPHGYAFCDSSRTPIDRFFEAGL